MPPEGAPGEPAAAGSAAGAAAATPAMRAPVEGFGYGALVISEWMADPATLSDADGEWVELFNASAEPIELGGCAIASGDGTPRSLDEGGALAPGAYATVANTASPGFEATVARALGLKNGAGTIEILCGGVSFDRVEYDEARGFPMRPGAATALDPAQLDADANDDASVWCLGETEYATDRGTPGAANPPCPGSDAGVMQAAESADAGLAMSDGGVSGASPVGPAERGALAPGAVVISEIMADPAAVRDELGEWVELFNATEEPIDLAGCELGDGGATRRTIAGPLTVEPRGFATIASSSEAGFTPNLAMPLSLKNSSDVVELRCGGELVDRVAYDAAADFPIVRGTAASLEPNRTSAEDNDRAEAWCPAAMEYAADRGTPGAPNPACVPGMVAQSADPAAGDAKLAEASPAGAKPATDGVERGASREPLAAGALVISEIMADPAARSDADGEWIEVFNATSQALDLQGCEIGDGSAQAKSIADPTRVTAGGFATLAASAAAGFAPSAVVGLSLHNSADVVELRCGGTVVDRVAYDRAAGFPTLRGAAASLDPGRLAAGENEDPAAWCAATSELGGDRGSPGQPNPPCVREPSAAGSAHAMGGEREPTGTQPGSAPRREPAPAPPPDPASDATGSDAPAPRASLPYGAIVITEIMIDPAAVADARGEWIELFNATSQSVDLAGCAIRDGAAQPRVLTASLEIAARGYATVATSTEPGFVPRLASPLSLTNSADSVALFCGELLVDRVAYDSAAGFPVVSGAAAALDPEQLDADANDAPSAWCAASQEYAGDRGTPGAANAACRSGRPAPPTAAEAPAKPDARASSPRERGGAAGMGAPESTSESAPAPAAPAPPAGGAPDEAAPLPDEAEPSADEGAPGPNAGAAPEGGEESAHETEPPADEGAPDGNGGAASEGGEESATDEAAPPVDGGAADGNGGAAPEGGEESAHETEPPAGEGAPDGNSGAASEGGEESAGG